VTSNLPILSVLAVAFFFILYDFNIIEYVFTYFKSLPIFIIIF